MKNSFLLFCLIFLTPFIATAQEAVQPRPSPLAITSMRYKNTYVKIVYSQPHKRGREIFGGLVPFGEVWRMGANEATEITLTQDILINAVLLKAGTYSIFTIPDKIKWTIIINSDVGLWGAYNYNPKLDVMRFDIPVQETDTVYEALTMAFDQNNDKADLNISWDRTKVTIPIRFINEN